jgi:hypothetical protein
MMSFRLFLLLAMLCGSLAGCVSTGNTDSLEQIERNHRQALETTA